MNDMAVSRLRDVLTLVNTPQAMTLPAAEFASPAPLAITLWPKSFEAPGTMVNKL